MVCVQFSSVDEMEREFRHTPELSACLRNQRVTNSTTDALSKQRHVLLLHLNKLRKKLMLWYYSIPLQTVRRPQELELQSFNSRPFIQVVAAHI
eukprot:g1236.t1